MKRFAALVAVASGIIVIAMSNAEQEPDPLTADLQLVTPADKNNNQVEDYKYGDKLDVKEVISVKSDPMACGITPEVMVYKDSHGTVHTVRYEVIGKGCQNN